MPRPIKYATAQEAAEQSLYSRLGGEKHDLTLNGFMTIATSPCFLCGTKPNEDMYVVRKDGNFRLWYHRIVTLRSNEDITVKVVAMCKMCRLLHRHFDIRALVSHCARIMARRMHKVHSKWFSQSQE